MLRLCGFSLLFFVLVLCGCSHNAVTNESYDAELSQYSYPYPVHDFEFTSQNQKLVMRYGDLGERNWKKVIVLLHGKNFAGFYWERVALDLVKKGYRVIIPDQVGFGKSSKPQHYQYSFFQLADNTYQLLNFLGIHQFEVVGHSMGGMLAVHMASMRPDVRRLVLVNPIGLENYLDFVEYKDPEFFYKSQLKMTVNDYRNYQRQNYYDGRWHEDYEKLLAPFNGWRQGPDWDVVAWNNALTYGPIFTDEIVSHFSKLSIPMVLILGTRDKTGPGRGWKKPGVNKTLGQYDQLGHQIKKLNPKRIQLFELKGLGHMPQFEDYKAFSEVFFKVL